MSFTRTSESGNYESTTRTIGALIEREWTTTDPAINKSTPLFLYDDDRPNITNMTEMASSIEFRGGNTATRDDRTSAGHDMVGVEEQVVITIYAESEKRRRLFEREVWRIIRKNRPRGTAATLIKKSDNSSNSPIHDFDEILPEFIAFDEDVKGQERSNKSSAILTCIMEYQFA
jgi:hypothetical protein